MRPLRILSSDSVAPQNLLVLAVALFVLGRLVLMSSDPMQGLLPGNDDFMRLQQIRDLLAGQSWFDVSQSRMLSPESGAMHWSRIPDLPVALLILVLSPVLGAPLAESVSITVWPIFLAAGALFLIVSIVRKLDLPALSQACALAFFLAPASLGNFAPGRIDHHGLLIVLTLAGFAALISTNRSARSALLLGVALVMLAATALEGLIYAVVLIGLLGLSWIVVGHRESVRMTIVGAVLFVSAPLAFTLDAPGYLRAASFCDAYSLPHMSALMFGGGLLIGLGVFAGQLIDVRSRFAFGVFVGLATLCLFAIIPPGCFGDPYAALPSSVRDMWLQNVSEAQGLFKVFASDLSLAISRFGFLAVAMVAALVLLLRAGHGSYLPRALLCVALLAMAILSGWQIRGASFGTAFASIAAGGLIGQLLLDWRKERGAPRAAIAFAGVLLLPPANWALVGARLEGQSISNASPAASATCRDPGFYREIGDQPMLTIFGPVDLGTTVLVHTNHNMFAGPYHRNPQGIESIGTVFSGTVPAARTELARLQADHVLFCTNLSETNHYLKPSDQSFAATLNRGETIAWLETVAGAPGQAGEPVLYKIKDPRASD